MNKKFSVNKRIRINEIGNSFTIHKMEGMIGKVVFSLTNNEKSKGYQLYKDASFNILKLREENHLDFTPEYIEFTTDVKTGVISLIIP